jgi:hypothetical protein
MARCESSWEANSTILTRSKVRARCWAGERYPYPQPLEIPVGVTSTSANRTSPANNPDNQLSHPASHYGPIETGKRKPSPKLIAIPIRPSRPHMAEIGWVDQIPIGRERPSSFHASVSCSTPGPLTSRGPPPFRTRFRRITAAAAAPPQLPHPKKQEETGY